MNRARIGWIAGALGVVVSAGAWFVAPRSFAFAWLASFSCWIGWPLGSLALLLVHALTGGRWGVQIRPQLVAGLATLPLAVPFALPLPFLLSTLYPWAVPGAHPTAAFYLNLPFFAVRGIIYLAVWLGLGGLTLRALRVGGASLRHLAPPALILLALTFNFAAIDLTMSLDPRFASSIYGMLAGAEAVLFALSVAVFAATFGAKAGDPATADLGKLLLALVVFWAYLDFMQVLIVWQSNLPDEAAWYLPRITAGWGLVAAAVALLHFALPFFLLLRGRWQARLHLLRGVAALLVVGEILRAWWLVLPAGGGGVGVADVSAMVALFGLGAGLAFRSMDLRPVAAALHHG